MTYSVNITQPTESTSYGDISYILNNLPDNLNKEVSPRDIRDAIISSWDVPSFKETTSTSSVISYIGIDSGNPSNRDIESKIFFGKRQFGTTQVMTSDLLNSDVDIFFYNTKIDTHSQLKTRLSILSGTSSSLYIKAPYLQSQVASATAGQVLTLDIVNPSSTGGNIIFQSEYGNVSINGLSFPTIANSGASVSNLRTLRYNNGDLYWDDIIVNFYDTVGATGSPLSIFGTPVLVNGSPIEFTNTNKTPVPIYGVGMGRTFNSVPIVEVLREILYPYLAPVCTLSINQSVAEYGTFPSIKLNYTVTKRTNNVISIALANMIPGSHPPIFSSSHVTISGSSSGVYISNTTTSFQVIANDGTQSISASQSLTFVYPYFFGLLSNSSINFAGLSTLGKVVEKQGDKIVGLVGSGYIYYIYDNNYPALSQILDNNNIDVTSSFTYSVVTLTSPSWLWASHQFKVYRSMTSSYSYSPPSVNYQFKY